MYIYIYNYTYSVTFPWCLININKHMLSNFITSLGPLFFPGLGVSEKGVYPQIQGRVNICSWGDDDWPKDFGGSPLTNVCFSLLQPWWGGNKSARLPRRFQPDDFPRCHATQLHMSILDFSGFSHDMSRRVSGDIYCTEEITGATYHI